MLVTVTAMIDVEEGEVVPEANEVRSHKTNIHHNPIVLFEIEACRNPFRSCWCVAIQMPQKAAKSIFHRLLPKSAFLPQAIPPANFENKKKKTKSVEKR